MALFGRAYVYVIDGSEGFLDNPVDFIDSVLTVGDVTVTSVEDMVGQIEKKVGKNLVANLFIGGHGGPGYQSVGAGTRWDATGAKSLQLDGALGRLRGPAEQALRRLAPRFTRDAIVTLGGCQVGNGAAGQALLRAASACLGVPVQAGTANQRPLFPGMEGDVIRCKGAECKNLGGGSWWASPGSWVQ